MWKSRNYLSLPLIALGLVFGVVSCQHHHEHTDAAAASYSEMRKQKHVAVPLERPGLHHLYRLTAMLYSGAEPKGDEAFSAMQKLGIRTIISVDGARPDAAQAAMFGMRYVHLPFGYDTISSDRGRSIVRAARDLPGPLYIHCHHGKHRGPAAAMLPLIALAGWTNAEAVGAMQAIGTAEKYAGLYATVRDFKTPSDDEISAADASFPVYNKVPPLAQAMAQISRRWDHLKAVRRAGWKTPADNSDLNPPHEALQLRELFHELGRAAKVKKRPANFLSWLTQGENNTRSIEAHLRKSDYPAAEIAYKKIAASCRACHTKYRGDD